MILREWRGRASSGHRDGYPDHFRRGVAPELQRISGFLGAHLFRHEGDDRIEYLVLTRWASLGAIQAFAGEDIEKAVVEPAAIAALIDYDERVRHYELVEEVHPSERGAVA